jgi:hypothetical protein
MAKIVALYDRAVRDFFPYQQQAKVEREKDKPYLTDLALAFLARKGLSKEEGGKRTLAVGVGWAVAGRVDTRPGHYIVPLKDDPIKEATKPAG